MQKIDIQRAECMTEQAKQRNLLEETGTDMSSYGLQGTNARAHVMQSQTTIKRLQDSVSKLNHELTTYQSKCKDETGALKKQIELIEGDTGTLSELASTTCVSSTAGFLQTGLLHCHSQVRKKPYIAFRHPKLQQQASQLKSPTARRALQTALKEAFMQVAVKRHHRHRRYGHRREGHRARHHRRLREHRYRHPRWQRRHLREIRYPRRLHYRHGRPHLALLSKESTTRLARSPLSKSNTTAMKPKVRCTMDTDANCDTVRDKLMFMQAGILDNIDSHRAELASAQHDCKSTENNLQEQITETHQRLMEQQEMLAEATTIQIDADEQSRLKGQEYDRLQAEYTKLNSFCKDSLSAAAEELCKIKSIRLELFKMEGQNVFIQDCEVSAWTPGECDKACAGGFQKLTRQVVVPDEKGAKCPALEAQTNCNGQPCPINCEMEEWSGWTSCSAKCGGGVMQRIRHINRRGQHGGKLCGAETESRGCGMEACDKDCKLASWSEWSTCSKACGGGFSERVRRVIDTATASGSCAADDSEQRLQYTRCNPDKCKPKTADHLKCKSKVDVVLLVDSSGSLGSAGWDIVKQASADLVKAFDPALAKVAVLSYSGPINMDKFNLCTGKKTDGTFNLETDCKMKWVSHFTDGIDALATQIGSMEW
jgi:hypothetical protein